MPIVKNKYKDTIEKDDVYIGRGSIYGNPFVIGKDGTREEVCQKYKAYWEQNVNLQEKTKNLKDKNLVCFCAPLQCHGDFLLEKANVC